MKIALLGTGIMGTPLGQRILKAGYPLTVYNRTPAKARLLVRQGAKLAASPQAAIAAGDVVVLMLANAPAIHKFVLSPSAKKVIRGRTYIQMGTIGPDESRSIAAQIKKHGGDYAECPVLGSIAEVENGKLILMFGGSPVQFRRQQKFLQCLGQKPRRIGPVGAAAALKLSLNQLIASHIVGFSQSLALVQKSGVEVGLFMEILKQSALFAPMFEKKLPRLLARQYSNPNFSTRNMLKDVRLFLAAGEPLGLDLKTLRSTAKVLEQVIAEGFAESDYCSVYETISRAGG